MSSASDSVTKSNTTKPNLRLDISQPVGTTFQFQTQVSKDLPASSPEPRDNSPENEAHQSLLQGNIILYLHGFLFYFSEIQVNL